jgi:hypothetical protein
MSTDHKDWKTAIFKYTCEDNNDGLEVRKSDRKEHKRYRKITAKVDKKNIILSGFALTGTNKLRSTIKKVIERWLANIPTTATTETTNEPIEHSYLLTIIDVFSKYAWVFPLQTRTGAEVAIHLHELFSQPFVGREATHTDPSFY